jgi:hypothetical protein
VHVPPFLSDSNLTNAFPEASWADVQNTELLRRFDRKFVLRTDQLESVLGAIVGKYRLLPSAGHPLATYNTTYFDTPELFMFTQHARGRRPRFKVRIRHYPERCLSFLEIKRKTNRGETAKKRVELTYGQDEIVAANYDFVHKHTKLDPASLRPILSTHFKRLTLIEPLLGERVTSDVFLSFKSGAVSREMQGVVVAEVKQADAMSRSAVVDALRAIGARPRSFSKYSFGVALCGLSTRIGTFRPGLRMIERLVHA